MTGVKCKICGKESSYLFEAKVLKKYSVVYFRCLGCKFIQTEDPHWLKEAYSENNQSIDIGQVHRSLLFSEEISEIIEKSFNPKGRFLDYGGGSGLFTRIMRDRGYDFWRYEPNYKNIFSQFFDISDLEKSQRKFELLTAIEVFEHLLNPKDEIEKMLGLSDTILFSTQLSADNIKSVSDWKYFNQDFGQHISLYSKESLAFLAKEFGLNFYSRKNLHILTKKTFQSLLFERKSFLDNVRLKLAKIISPRKAARPSLLAEDSKKIYL